MQVNSIDSTNFTGLLGAKTAKKVYKNGTIGRRLINDAQKALKTSSPYNVSYHSGSDSFSVVGIGHAPVKTIKTPEVEIGEFSPSGRVRLTTKDGDHFLLRVIHLGDKRKTTLIDVKAGRRGRESVGIIDQPEDLPTLVKIVNALNAAAKAVTEKV